MEVHCGVYERKGLAQPAEATGPFFRPEQHLPVPAPGPGLAPIHCAQDFCCGFGPSDLDAGGDLEENILVSQITEQTPMLPTTPFFSGSPPERPENPMIHEPRFGEPLPIDSFVLTDCPVDLPILDLPGTSSWMKECNPAKFSSAPTVVRVEGFDCLDRDRRRRRIVADA